MLESIFNSRNIYYVMGAVTICGMVSKMVVNVSLGKLVRAASNMGKSPHRLMKLVRAKFEHAYMVNDHVGNIDVFIEKYIREYQVLKIRLCRWQRLEKIFAIILSLLILASGFVTYYAAGFGDMILQRVGVGVALLIAMLGTYQLFDEKFKMQSTKIYMTDYLENVCALRYQRENEVKERVVIPALKENKKREKNSSQKLEEQLSNIEACTFEPETQEAELAFPIEEREEQRPTLSMVEKLLIEEAERREELKKQKQEEYMPNEAAIREILQEFMA